MGSDSNLTDRNPKALLLFPTMLRKLSLTANAFRNVRGGRGFNIVCSAFGGHFDNLRNN
jgi:hypothetical protein